MELKLKPIYRLIIQPGLWRDYSSFSSPGCTDLLWFRFYHERLRKIGGWKYITGLPIYTLSEDFQNSLQNTEPSYPSKQYINQDLTKPWEANFIDESDTAYENYNFNTPSILATYPNTNNITSVGYRIPRKIINVVLDGVNQIIVTADYNQPNVGSDASAGGISFGQLLSNPSDTQMVNGRFPQLDNTAARNTFGYTPNTSYVWSLDYVNLTTGFTTADTSTYIVCHPSCQTGIADPTNRYVFIIAANNLVDGALMSPISSSTPVTALAPPYATEVSVSGGVCVVGPFVFAYGNNGLIRWSDVNNPLKWANPGSPDWQYSPGLANDVNESNAKIVKGISVKGMGTYSALFWSLNSLILATYIGSPAVFSFTEIATNISIIAPNSVVERSGEYYWVGDGRFFRFVRGFLEEIPNVQNRAWFFDNININYQHLTWGFLNPRFNEIWWLFPYGSSTECNWALIYNYESNVWYDTPLNRSCGVYSSVFGAPLLGSNQLNTNELSYNLYLHEQGYDAMNKDGSSTPIPSYFVTGDLGYLSSQPASPKAPQNLLQNWMYVRTLEPDANYAGTWKATFISREYANAPLLDSTTSYEFNENTYKIDLREQGRIMQLKVESGQIGSFFFLGSFMFTSDTGDGEGV